MLGNSPGSEFLGWEVAEQLCKSSSLSKWLSRTQERCVHALAHCICVKVPNIDLGNHLRYGPLLLPCFQRAPFSKRTKIWKTIRFIKSCFSPCCTRQPLLLLPGDTVRGFVRPSIFQHGQPLVRAAGATKALGHPACMSPCPAGRGAQLLSTGHKEESAEILPPRPSS